MFTDWYVVRRGKVDVRELYEPKGIYSYCYGFNLRAIGAWILAFAPNIPGFAHSINANNPDVNPWTYSASFLLPSPFPRRSLLSLTTVLTSHRIRVFSWYFSTVTAIFWYLLINFIFPPKSSFVETAVYEVYDLEYEGSVAGPSSVEGQTDEEKDISAGVPAVSV
jgi:NCS1 family nucleobase:cation symporter-1